MLYTFEKHPFCLESALSSLFKDSQAFDKFCRNTKSTNLLKLRLDRLNKEITMNIWYHPMIFNMYTIYVDGINIS